MRIRKSFIIGSVYVVGALAAAASAETITATVTGVDPFVGGSVSLTDYGTITGGAVSNTLWQGASDNSSPFGGAFNTYCIDVIQDISIGGTYSFTEEPIQDAPKSSAFPSGTPTTGMGTVKADEMEALFGVDYSKTVASSAFLDREAFQLAVWNIIYDTDASVSQGAGSFNALNDTGVDPGAIPLANTFLADALNPDNQQYDMTNLIALVGQNGVQDQIAVISGSDVHISAVPTPAPGTAAAVLLAGYGVYSWRRSRRLAKLEQ
jgi:hypothetical protein